jgi:hypothetical protein
LKEEFVMPVSPQIRRIRETDADAVVELWDRMCREVRDGGPLTAAGRRNLARMLAVTAWHRDTFCLVATDGDEVVGFALGRIDTGDGLLPGVIGEIQELYAPAGLRIPLAGAVIARLRELGAATLRTRVAADEPEEQQFWSGQGFEADMVVMSRYDATP